MSPKTELPPELGDGYELTFARYELLLTPTLAVPPFQVGFNEPPDHVDKHGSRLGWVAFTYPWSQRSRMHGRPDVVPSNGDKTRDRADW